jgi:D-glycero-D-manno-heptose 1,7-bisphosphate phosphatase
MLLQAAAEMGINLRKSYLVGDAASDLVAGQQVGCRSCLVLTGRGKHELLTALRSVERFSIARNLMGATAHILKAELELPDTNEVWSPAYWGYARQPVAAVGNM